METYTCRGCDTTNQYHHDAGARPPEYCRSCLPRYRAAHPPIPDLTPQPFADQALCRQVDPDLFVPTGQGCSVATAKKVCRACPVINECLAWALENPDPNAIYGGLTARERRKLRPAVAA